MNISKLALLSIMSVFSLGAMQIPKDHLMTPHNLRHIEVYRTNTEYVVRKNEQIKTIAPEDVSPLLRKGTPEKLKAFINCGGYVKVTEASNGDYMLTDHTRLVGGGIGGCLWGTVLGKAAVVFASQVAIACVSVPVGIVAGPIAGGALHATITEVAAPWVAAAALVGSLAGGMGGAVITGPV